MEFRVRDGGSNRLEALSDAVFAFSATLLVVSLEVPNTFDQLISNLRGFVGFGLSFTLLMMIWTAHHGFFRRYGLQDLGTIAINSVLLFLVLFYVYPLKFLTSLIAGFHLGIEGTRDMLDSSADMVNLMLLYSGGFIAVYLCFVALYLSALSKREQLGLDLGEILDGRTMVRHYLIYVGVGALSIVLTLAHVGISFGFPGWFYASIGPLCTLHGRWSQRRKDAALKAAAEPATTKVG